MPFQVAPVAAFEPDFWSSNTRKKLRFFKSFSFQFPAKNCNVIRMSNSEIDSAPTEVVEVTIFNETYRLRSKTDGEQVRQMARLVDERMRQIASHVTTHDVLKIAVLAALNIADEMENLRNYYESEVHPLLSKLPENQGGAEKEDERSAESNRPQSWFEDFFEAKVETKHRAERLSSQVSAKLQSLRQPNTEQPGIMSEDERPERQG